VAFFVEWPWGGTDELAKRARIINGSKVRMTLVAMTLVAMTLVAGQSSRLGSKQGSYGAADH